MKRVAIDVITSSDFPQDIKDILIYICGRDGFARPLFAIDDTEIDPQNTPYWRVECNNVGEQRRVEDHIFAMISEWSKKTLPKATWGNTDAKDGHNHDEFVVINGNVTHKSWL